MMMMMMIKAVQIKRKVLKNNKLFVILSCESVIRASKLLI